MLIKIDSIILEKETQPRVNLNSETINEYAELYKEDTIFPAITVFENDGKRWLADGWHRLYAAKQAERKTIEAEIIEGNLRDAILYSVKANADHGMRRTNADKRRAVTILLNDKEWNKWSDRTIAQKCAVSNNFVSELRKLVSSDDSIDIIENGENTRTYIHPKTGEETEMKIKNIIDPIVEDKPDLVLSGSPPLEGSAKFNRTNNNIEWAAWTWNPVTGCKHGCEYCYARDIAERFTGGFEPAFKPERLCAPQNTNPDMTIPGGSNVFVCSMADLFGTWVPNEWIFKVMEQVKNNPQWNFIFLTKNPKRYKSIQFPDNAWVGTTVDTQKRVAIAEENMIDVDAKIKFVSCEPMLEKLTFTNLKIFNWVIIGARSRNTKCEEFQPDIKWVKSLWDQAEKAKCKVYWKPNLTIRPKEYPI